MNGAERARFPTGGSEGPMMIRYHRGDLPESYSATGSVAVDTETLGLNPYRDRLCVVQLSTGDGTAEIVQILKDGQRPERLTRLLADRSILKIFHFARFDLAVLERYLGVMPEPVYCTKIASKLTRTYTDKHSLKDLVRELLNVTLQKEQQSSDWGADALTPAQLDYAASDVLHLHALKEKFDLLLAREGRSEIAEYCFAFLPTRARLDLMGWADTDIFAHS
jgi:ribonuclease D